MKLLGSKPASNPEIIGVKTCPHSEKNYLVWNPPSSQKLLGSIPAATAEITWFGPSSHCRNYLVQFPLPSRKIIGFDSWPNNLLSPHSEIQKLLVSKPDSTIFFYPILYQEIIGFESWLTVIHTTNQKIIGFDSWPNFVSFPQRNYWVWVSTPKIDAYPVLQMGWNAYPLFDICSIFVQHI